MGCDASRQPLRHAGRGCKLRPSVVDWSHLTLPPAAVQRDGVELFYDAASYLLNLLAVHAAAQPEIGGPQRVRGCPGASRPHRPHSIYPWQMALHIFAAVFSMASMTGFAVAFPPTPTTQRRLITNKPLNSSLWPAGDPHHYGGAAAPRPHGAAGDPLAGQVRAGRGGGRRCRDQPLTPPAHRGSPRRAGSSGCRRGGARGALALPP